MCRLAAFPPNFPRFKALEILLDFEGRNTDGFGSVFVRDNEFVVDKAPKGLSDALKAKHPFLAHMPYNGWTVAHLRAASHGCNAKRNTHPFIVDDMAVVHNGIWSDYTVAKLLLPKGVQLKGETDSEVAAHVINLIGMKKFALNITFGGVFMALHRNGELEVGRTSGDLDVFHRSDKTVLLASDLSMFKYQKKYEADKGWFKYNKNGKYMAHKFVKKEDDDDGYEYVWKPNGSYFGGHHYGGGSGTNIGGGTPNVWGGNNNFPAQVPVKQNEEDNFSERGPDDRDYGGAMYGRWWRENT